MGGITNGRRDVPFDNAANGHSLAALTAKYKEYQKSLLKAVETNDDALVSEFDAKISHTFEQILGFPLKKREDYVLLAEFLLGQLHVESSPMNDSIRSKILDIIKGGSNY